ncbi:MAG: hypothetical protein F4Y60_02190 [Boseongicola sp. SB0664_bin_43]|uniref:Uncharacterized protein n=1 Tax=Boseongicola sp. SB0664_bin_43 TaxID=2604844 RepID=A0A6B0XW61_9RHOB|nr:hypothetical protein [Boseongicola sp. SB0664_bin_43]MYK33487.1 hypothetical protein [Boseongicola sp. SB0670_bin_30]
MSGSHKARPNTTHAASVQFLTGKPISTDTVAVGLWLASMRILPKPMKTNSVDSRFEACRKVLPVEGSRSIPRRAADARGHYPNTVESRLGGGLPDGLCLTRGLNPAQKLSG